MCATPVAPAFCCVLFTALSSPHAISCLLPSPSSHLPVCSAAPCQTPAPQRPRPSPPAAFLSTPFPLFMGAHAYPLVPLAIGDSATTCRLRTAKQRRIRAPLRRRPSAQLPAGSASSHVTASLTRSTWRPRFCLFPAFFLPTWNLRETESSLPTLWRGKSKL